MFMSMCMDWPANSGCLFGKGFGLFEVAHRDVWEQEETARGAWLERVEQYQFNFFDHLAGTCIPS